MSNYITTDTSLTFIADAIREKGSTSAQLEYPDGFITAIENISGEAVINPLSVTANGTYTAPSGVDGYSPVTVNVVPSPKPAPVIPGEWTRPNTYPDLDSLTYGTDVNEVYFVVDKSYSSDTSFIVTSYNSVDTLTYGTISNGVYTPTSENLFTNHSGNNTIDISGISDSVILFKGTYGSQRNSDSNTSSLFAEAYINFNNTEMPVVIKGNKIRHIYIKHFTFTDNIYFSLQYCYDLQKLDIDNWDGILNGVSFNYCTSLLSLDASKMDVSKVTNLINIFSHCESLQSIDVSTWDVSKGTNLYGTFSSCYCLQTLDLSNWDISAVNTMTSTFDRCFSLQSLNLTGWDTSNVSNLQGTFTNCRSLKSLDLSNWDTSKVTTMYQTFYECHALEDLNLSNWDVSNVNTMYYMFAYCYSLKNLTIDSDWDTSKVTSMEYMFRECSNLQELDLSDWNTSAVTNMRHIFYRCTGLQLLDIGGWNMGGITSKANVRDIFVDLSSMRDFTAPTLQLTSYFPYNTSAYFSNALYRRSFLSFVNSLATVTTTTTLKFSTSLQYKLTDADVAIAQDKGYTISFSEL